MTTNNMHRKDFKPCAICHKGVMHTGLPLFWRVHIERIGVDMQAAQRRPPVRRLGAGPCRAGSQPPAARGHEADRQVGLLAAG